MIDQATADKIINTADIVDVVSEFVTLRRSGANYKGLCPFHNEKTPSFMVSPAKGVCKCFSCGKGGNVVHFLMEHEQFSYPEALRWLAKKYNIEIEEKELTAEQKQAQSERESMFIVNEWARDYFHSNLYNSVDGMAIGMAYFRSRGFRDDIIKKFQLGFSLNSFDALTKEAIAHGFDKKFLLATSICKQKEDGSLYDTFRGRVMFPWISVSGKVVAFGGRVLDAATKGVNQKYVNSSESSIYSKRRELYGLYQAKKAIAKENRVFMVEGYTDVISMHQCGIENVVANSGTALSMEQVRLLHRFTSNITLLYDGDDAGIHATQRGTDMLLTEGMNVKILLLPKDEDPDSFARTHTAEEFQQYINDHQVDFIRFKTKLLLDDIGNDPLKRAALVSDIVKSISVIPDGIVRQMYARESSNIMSVSEELILNEVMKQRRKASNDRRNAESEQPEPVEDASQVSAPQQPLVDNSNRDIEELERQLASLIVRHGHRIMFSDENGSENVAQYIDQEMQLDQIAFITPLYQKILSEALEQSHQPDFDAAVYFLQSADQEISLFAAQADSEDYPLSKRLQHGYVEVKNRLDELVPLLMSHYKYYIVRQRLDALRKELLNPDVKNNISRVMEVMKQIKDLNAVAEEFARHLDRVITK